MPLPVRLTLCSEGRAHAQAATTDTLANHSSTEHQRPWPTTINPPDRAQEARLTFGRIPIIDEMKRSYLDYAMSVIVARALPDVRDGLKPVHRRILYSMHENRITRRTDL